MTVSTRSTIGIALVALLAVAGARNALAAESELHVSPRYIEMDSSDFSRGTLSSDSVWLQQFTQEQGVVIDSIYVETVDFQGIDYPQFEIEFFAKPDDGGTASGFGPIGTSEVAEYELARINGSVVEDKIVVPYRGTVFLRGWSVGCNLYSMDPTLPCTSVDTPALIVVRLILCSRPMNQPAAELARDTILVKGYYWSAAGQTSVAPQVPRPNKPRAPENRTRYLDIRGRADSPAGPTGAAGVLITPSGTPHIRITR